MRTHTLLTKVTSMAVCFGVLLSGPVMAGSKGIIKDVELSRNGTLVGQVFTPEGKAVSDAPVYLRYQGTPIAAARSNSEGRFAIEGVRGGAHEIVVGALNHPVRLWSNGTAPKSATAGAVLSADETIVRGQDVYCDSCPPGGACGTCGPSGFGMLDVITLATVGAAVGALVVGIDNKNTLEDLQAAVAAGSAVASP
jgi:hypothetical protein